MSSPKTHSRAGETQEMVTLRMNHSTFKVTFAQAFAFGHTLLRSERIQSASQIFDHLAQRHPQDRQVSIMLARCKARLGQYEECRQILSRFFEGDASPIGDRLHTAFVYRGLGLFPDARDELIAVVESCPDIPTACLTLGDLYEKVGRPDRAQEFWKLAAQRDKSNSSVSRSAISQIALLQKATKPKRRSPEKG